MSPTCAGMESNLVPEVEGRLPASAMTPPYNNLFYMSFSGWNIGGQIVCTLRSFFLSFIYVRRRLDVVCVGKFPLLPVWKELPFNCEQIHKLILNKCALLIKSFLSAVWPELHCMNNFIAFFVRSQPLLQRIMFLVNLALTEESILWWSRMEE